MAKAIDEKYLKGLKFSSSEGKKVKGENGDKIKHTPVERDLKPADVLDWKDNGESVTIVTADGRKHVVGKSGKDKEGKEGGK